MFINKLFIYDEVNMLLFMYVYIVMLVNQDPT